MLKFLVFISFGFALTAQIVRAESLNFAVIDIKKIEEDALVAKDLQKKIDEATQNLEKTILSEKERMEKKVADIQKIASTLSMEAQEKKRVELQKEVMEIETSLQQRDREIQEARIKALETINDKVKQISIKISKDKGYNAVLTSAFLVYYPASIDITKEVIESLNKEMKIVNFTIKNKKK